MYTGQMPKHGTLETPIISNKKRSQCTVTAVGFMKGPRGRTYEDGQNE